MDNYIVVFKSTASKSQIEDWAQQIIKDGGEVKQRWFTALKGFSARLNQNSLNKLRAFAASPNSVIHYIEKDGTAHIMNGKPGMGF